jgi:hypothetical protein
VLVIHLFLRLLRTFWVIGLDVNLKVHVVGTQLLHSQLRPNRTVIPKVLSKVAYLSDSSECLFGISTIFLSHGYIQSPTTLPGFVLTPTFGDESI